MSHTKFPWSVVEKRKLKLAATFFIFKFVVADFSLRNSTNNHPDILSWVTGFSLLITHDAPRKVNRSGLFSTLIRIKPTA